MRSIEEICREYAIPLEEGEEILYNMLCDVKNYGLTRKTLCDEDVHEVLFNYLLKEEFIAFDVSHFFLTLKGKRVFSRGYIYVDLQLIREEERQAKTEKVIEVAGKLLGSIIK